MPLNNLIKRLVKGSPLTATEHDGNLTKIQNAFNGLENRFGLLDAGVTATTPPSDTTQTWHRLNTDGVIEGSYRYIGSQWVRPHPIAPSTQWAAPYIGDAASVATLDGGTNTGVSDAAGPFWEIVTAIGGKMPIGVGTLASGASVSVNGTGGSETVALTTDQLPAHTHVTNVPAATSGSGPNLVFANAYANFIDRPVTSQPTGEGDAHPNMPPYYGVYFLRRTARKFIVAT
jgi:hypothetical protein